MTSNKITRRWLRNSFGVIVAIVVLIEIVAAVAVQRYYYSSARQTLQTRADVVASTFEQYAKDSTKDFTTQVRSYVVGFEEKETMELMIIDKDGEVLFTSSGFFPDDHHMPDYQNAIEQNTRVGSAIGSVGTNERVMMLSVLTPAKEQPDISAVRLATSLTEIDKQIAGMIAGMVGLGVAVLSLVLFSSSYFINSIVRPIDQVGQTARKIAEGDFEARLQIQSDDEIGELADIINYMADELGTAEQVKNDFISSVSHELRTPLTAIQGWAETIAYDGGENKALLEKGMHVIAGETERLSGMVEELLDFSRMQSGRLKLIKSKTDVISELSEAVLMYTQRAQREKIELEYVEPEEIAVVFGDRNRLRQVFINILDNAIKYSDPGDVVTVSTDFRPDSITIEISDTGIGISAQDLPQITNRFYKADTTRRGSGIGLAVAEEIILRHDGLLTVNSEKDVGTTIRIVLPLLKGEGTTKVEEDSAYIESESHERDI